MENVMILNEKGNNMMTIMGGMSKLAQSHKKEQDATQEVIDLFSSFLQEYQATQVTTDTRISGVEGGVNKINEVIRTADITAGEKDGITRARRKKIASLLGGTKSSEFKLFASAYFRTLGGGILENFKHTDKPLLSYASIKRTQFKDVIKYIENWNPEDSYIQASVLQQSLDLEKDIKKLQREFDEKINEMKESKKYTMGSKIAKKKEKLETFNNYLNKKLKEQNDNILN